MFSATLHLRSLRGCNVVARLDYRISSSRTKSVELKIYGGGVGGMAYFVRRFCSLPRLAFLCPFRSAGFTRGGESRPGQGFGNEVFSGRRNGRAAIAHGWPVEKGRDALLKFATLSVASLRLIKNCAGLCGSLYACGQGNCTRVTIK